MNNVPREIIYNIFSYLDIISKSKFGITNKFNNKVYKDYILKKTSITQSRNYFGCNVIKSFLYNYNDNVKYIKEFPFQLKDRFVEIKLRDCKRFYFLIIIYQPIYSKEKCIFDYIREMNYFKIWKITTAE
jgi:hypothetical protein